MLMKGIALACNCDRRRLDNGKSCLRIVSLRGRSFRRLTDFTGRHAAYALVQVSGEDRMGNVRCEWNRLLMGMMLMNLSDNA
jgi:hypothetical protein